MSEPLTPRRCLESLRKEAKQWLAALRQHSPDALLGELASLDQLTTLRLGGSRALTDAGARHLGRLP
jgi:hypothetical protein